MRLLNLTLLPFNSTMVRLKDEGAAKFLLKNSFQFHYGTIKRRRATCLSFPTANFNSTMVRLKEPAAIPKAIHQRFQFHYGTIKSLITPDEVANLSRFQFHYGTIKSEFHIYRGTHIHNFNSTMVRLKGEVMKHHASSTSISIPLWYD